MAVVKNAPYGQGVPFGDPSWYRSFNSPYYKESHKKFRERVRKFTETEIFPNVHEWDEAKALPKELFAKAGAAGWLPVCVGGPWRKEYVGEPLEELKEFDYFHELIMIDELSRCGSGGVLWGLFGGLSIGLPPVLNFGSPALQQKCARDCLMGKKFICLAITEPYAGSDVANIRTTAVKDPTGKFFVVNGEKKWITNGVFADYFTVAVRTGGEGMGGISLLLLEKGMAGLETKQMKCMGVWSSGTTYITMEDVKVPVENLIGKENEGFKCIMYD